MGCNLIARSCYSSPYAPPASGNPDPEKFVIMHEQTIGQYLVLLVNYPSCKNFEGRKLMVYKGWKSSKDLLFFNGGKLDPHFANSKGAPIARFAPVSSSLEYIERMIGTP